MIPFTDLLSQRVSQDAQVDRNELRNVRTHGKSGSDWQHPRNNRSYDTRLMLSYCALKGVGALESIGPGNLHLPPICTLRSQDHYAPFPGPVSQDVFDHRD
jgi:hypothetical protein